jgi:large subunit ribosomal protein L25
METITLNASVRGVGKKASAESRRSGQIPCVLYGNGVEAVYFQVTPVSLKPLIYTDKYHKAEVTIHGTTYQCVIKEVIFHPTTDKPTHVDFQALVDGKKIRTSIPVHCEGTPVGVTAGGALKKIVHRVKIECEPSALLSYIPVNVTNLNIGDDVRVSNLAIDGIKFITPGSQSIAAVVTKRAVK